MGERKPIICSLFLLPALKVLQLLLTSFIALQLAFAGDHPPNSRRTDSKQATGEFSHSLQNARSHGLWWPSHRLRLSSPSTARLLFSGQLLGSSTKNRVFPWRSPSSKYSSVFYSHWCFTRCPTCLSKAMPG